MPVKRISLLNARVMYWNRCMVVAFVLGFCSGCASLSVTGPKGDRWTSPDKVAHFFFSALISGMVAARLENRGQSPCGAMTHAVALTLGLGAAKEIHDARQEKNAFSIKDMTANTVGALAGGQLVTGGC